MKLDRKNMYELIMIAFIEALWFGMMFPALMNLDETSIVIGCFIINMIAIIEGGMRIHKIFTHK